MKSRAGIVLCDNNGVFNVEKAISNNKRLYSIVYCQAPSLLKNVFDQSSCMLAVTHRLNIVKDMVANCIQK